MTRYRELTAALLVILIGAAGALLIAGRTWQVIRAARPRPAADVVTHATGHDLAPAVAGLAVVALAGVVAVLATRGLARRVVGGLIAVCGAILIWRAALAVGPVGAGRARALLTDGLSGVSLAPGVEPHVANHPAWPVLAIVAGLLVVAGGALVTVRGGRWSAMSSRYDAPTRAARAERAAGPASDLAVWTALDRGDDPTAAEPEPDAGPPAEEEPERNVDNVVPGQRPAKH